MNAFPMPGRGEASDAIAGSHAHLAQAFSIGGPGPTVVVKDVIDVAGYPTRAGSRALDPAPASRHADVVAALLTSGCRLIGKAKMHELAFGVTGISEGFGTPPNPLFTDFVPGGSSSGSATVVAAGIADFSLGTDTGGSIRVPAACCGIVGFKPTFGRLSRRGLTPAESSLDCVGPLARSVQTVAQAMVMLDPEFRRPEAVGRPHIGWVRVEAKREIAATVRSALQDAGCRIDEAVLPGMPAAFRAALTIIGAETARAFAHLLPGGLVGADVAARLRAGAGITTSEVEASEAVRRSFAAEVDDALDHFDVLALPTLPDAPVLLRNAADDAAALDMTRLVRPFNLSGHPAIALPVIGGTGLPLSFQLIGRRGDDARLCAIADLIERRSGRIGFMAQEERR